MIIKVNITVIFLLSFCFSLKAKEVSDKIAHQNYQWEDSTFVSVTPYDTLFDAVYIKDHTIKEWYKSGSFKGTDLRFSSMFLFTTVHKRIKLNNNQGVDDHNKMYLPVRSNEEIFKIHARAINPDGTITNFNESSIKEIEDLDGYGAYKIFAFEGVQVGSELEYFYTIKSVESEYYGTEIVQKEVPILDYGFQIIAPEDYQFSSKSYNGLDSLVLDSVSVSRQSLSLKGVFVEAFESESFSKRKALKQRLEYKLDYNEDDQGEEVYTWQKAADWYARTFYNRPSNAHVKTEKIAIRKILRAVGELDGLSIIQVIIRIENYLKVEFDLNSQSNAFYALDIFEKKEYSKLSAVRLYTLLLSHLGIEHEIVITSNRFKKPFDGDFESYSYLNHVFLYLPGENTYLNPSSEIHRIGTVPYGLTNQEGLFVKTLVVGYSVSAFPDVKAIPGSSYKDNYDILSVKVALSDDFKVATAEMKRSTLGHCSTSIQPYLPYLSDKRKDALLKEFFNDIALDAEVENLQTENEVITVDNNKPFTVSATVKLNSLVEKANEKYLFHIGDLIGPQSELYQEKERKFDISIRYNRQYQRVIEFTIPDGYEILNPEVLEEEEVLMVDSQKVAQFICGVYIRDSVLTVHIDEYYAKIDIDKKYYASYRRVINAAADFNKIVLVLTKLK